MIEQISKYAWEVVGLCISLAIAFWVLSMFIPIDSWLKSFFGMFKGDLRVCPACRVKNKPRAKFCVNCGERLRF